MKYDMKYELKPLLPEEAALIEEKIDAIDDSIAPPVPGARDEEIVLKIEDEDGNFIGGLISTFDNRASVELQNLWVDERYRGNGIGSALICATEREARARGCYISIVSTWSYQARPLYEKNGYTLRSTVTDWPKGYDSYYLSKRLDEPSAEYVPSKTARRGYEVKRGTKEDAYIVHINLHDYNCSKVPRLHPHRAFEKKLTDAEGNMIAGCTADLDSIDIVTLGMIWVDEAHRGQGVGSYLLAEVEREIKAAGGIFVVAYAYDWQKGFFEKNGYVSCGAIPDFPKGHSRYALKKIL